jgi:iron(III) transport system permease protein
MATTVPTSIHRVGRLKLDRDDWIIRGLLLGFTVLLIVALVIPLYMLISRSFHDASGEFIGLVNYVLYFETPALFLSINNSFFIATVSTIISVSLAFFYAYALTRTCMKFKGFFKVMALVPLLSPGILKAIALVYWFGNQGLLNEWLLGYSIYGPIGIVMGSVFWTFPHAVLVIATAMALSDLRLYEAADVMKTSRMRTFFTITLPGIQYGLISAFIIVFIRIFTDFGIPKVIGGNYNVLATDIYKEVVGQQNFEMGAVVSVVLLVPALIAFVIDRIVTRKQVAALTSRSVPYAPKPNKWLDGSLVIYCSLITVLMFCVLGMAQFASMVKFWPYNLELTLDHYQFDLIGVGWENFFNSIWLAFSASVFGTFIVFLGAYLVEKPRQGQDTMIRQIIQFLAMLPLAVPGLVLGLSYLFFINSPSNPFGFLYGTVAILAISTVTHYYTPTHLMAVTALKQMDREFEAVSASLKVPLTKSFWRITVPVCMPAILDISIYLFLNAMTTVSAIIFIYGPMSEVASIATIHMDEAGETASAAAMGMLIVYACLIVRILHGFISNKILNRLQEWRHR